ncbi:MAG: helix-turn-helix domain-containing protein [Pseudonocardiaceae bacterium]
MSAGQPDSGSLPGDSFPARPVSGPTALRIALGTQLRRLRESKGLTRQQAGTALRGSHAKIGRLELGQVGFKQRDVADLLTLYGVDDEQERATILALAQRANTPGWWHRYADILPGWFELYLGLEQDISVIRTYESHLVPGLLQTEDCARAVIEIGHPTATPEQIERRVALRLQRQQLLAQSDPPALWAVVDEAALRRLGGRAVTCTQIRHLIEISDLPHVTLQVMPFRSGAHPAASGPFSILRFSHPDLPDIVYLEQLTSALYLDKRADVEHYAVVMDRLCAQIDLPAATEDVLTAIRAEF